MTTTKITRLSLIILTSSVLVLSSVTPFTGGGAGGFTQLVDGDNNPSYFIQQASAQEEEVGVTTEEEESTTAGEAVVDEQPITPEEQLQPPIIATTEEEGQQPLSALFFIDSTNGDDAPATFLFETDPEGGTEPYTSFSWDFGDGSPQGSGEIVTHTYDNAGTYAVTVTVTNPTTGQTVTDTEQVTVQPMTTTTEGQQPLATTNATELFPPPPPKEMTIEGMTIDSTVVVNALLSALVALSPPPPSSPLPTNDTLQQEEGEAICTDEGGMNVTCPDVVMIIRGGELLRCWDEEDDIIRRGSYTEVICPGGEIEIPKNIPQLAAYVPRPKEMTID